MKLNQAAALAEDPVFQKQVRIAALNQASLVLAGKTETKNERADLKQWDLAAATIADGCRANLDRFVWTLAATPGFEAVPNDADGQNDAAISSAMTSQWKVLAGVTKADTGV